ncbi:hypothetical protein [Cognatiyoonia sp. IB215182]|uniref:hypothetical protein n=1 Tax=Cognatiyoonia sp. IB215182 TaxID=3097353 RepID=UPI002A17F938|nr:hypothetical protein [Cognatiyoonia sp. IB215182]MDX8355841.1 hypothetical protein [Cognatiyoonia sp. IB215182]
MEIENYKKLAINVRRNARASLLEIRQNRLARRKQIMSPMRPRQPASEKDTTKRSTIESELPASVVGDPTYSTDSEIIAQAGSTEDNHIDVDGCGDILDELASRNAAMPTNPELCSGPEAESAKEVYAEYAQASEKSNWSESELAKLPGAGPGLIWMLSQCGVFTLQDLAHQDEKKLASQLGIVGQIIDVGQWILFAQSKIQAQ